MANDVWLRCSGTATIHTIRTQSGHGTQTQYTQVRSLVVSLTLLFCDSNALTRCMCDWMLDVAIELYCRIHCTQNRRSASAFSALIELYRVSILQNTAPNAWQRLTMAHNARMMGNKHTKLHTLDQMLCFSSHFCHGGAGWECVRVWESDVCGKKEHRHCYDGWLLPGELKSSALTATQAHTLIDILCLALEVVSRLLQPENYSFTR